ncbi:MAG: N-acetyl-alpha-D-glucosaminyl L-malate synthase BshA [Deltaproteobacteria bacterium]|nr:N-acetyl-alpha-D-glucosaminyl L-malate synthase BshA [Deltaproteobacteria bacterium]
MKIAILCHSSPGGSGVLATELAFGLSQLGHEVHIIGDRKPFRMEEVDENAIYCDLGEAPPEQSFWGQLFEIVHSSFSRLFASYSHVDRKLQLHFHELLSFDYPLFDKCSFPTLRAANTLAKLIAEYGIELVNAHYVIPHATSALLARDSGINCRVVTTLHGTDITKVGPDAAFFFTTKHAIEASDGVTAVCQFLVREAQNNFSITRPISVIPNWVDPTRFVRIADPDERLKYAHPYETICVHVSNFRAVKRSPDVIRVFAKLLEKTQARLILVGEGPEKDGCLELAHNLGVSPWIIDIEPVAAVERILGIADMLFLPSEMEAFPLVLLEGMASGAVCLATEVGGIPELIVDGESGFLFPVGAWEKMAERAVELCCDASLSSTIRDNARKLVETKYSPRNLIRRYLDVYEEVFAN